jgi:hypothetical protein
LRYCLMVVVIVVVIIVVVVVVIVSILVLLYLNIYRKSSVCATHAATLNVDNNT